MKLMLYSYTLINGTRVIRAGFMCNWFYSTSNDTSRSEKVKRILVNRFMVADSIINISIMRKILSVIHRAVGQRKTKTSLIPPL